MNKEHVQYPFNMWSLIRRLSEKKYIRDVLFIKSMSLHNLSYNYIDDLEFQGCTMPSLKIKTEPVR